MRRRVALLLSCTAALAVDSGGLRPAVYRAINATVIPVLPVSRDVLSSGGGAACSPLPAGEFVVPPGTYCYGGDAFELREQGLHRMYTLGANGSAQQRVVLSADRPDVHALLSAIAWVQQHGTEDDRHWDDRRPYIELEQAALTRKLSLTCGNVSAFAREMLAKYVPAHAEGRVVGIAALHDEANAMYGYGPPPVEAHALLEVRFRTGLWALYDIDLNHMPVDAAGGTPLSILDLACAVRSGAPQPPRVQLLPLSGGTHLDANHPSSGGLLGAAQFEEELVRADPLRWYEAMLVGLYVHFPPKPRPVTLTLATCCLCDSADVSMLRSLDTFEYLSMEAYREKMYPNSSEVQ